MRRALTVGVPLLTRFASLASFFDNVSRPHSHIVQSWTALSWQESTFLESTRPLSDPSYIRPYGNVAIASLYVEAVLTCEQKMGWRGGETPPLAILFFFREKRDVFRGVFY